VSILGHSRWSMCKKLFASAPHPPGTGRRFFQQNESSPGLMPGHQAEPTLLDPSEKQSCIYRRLQYATENPCISAEIGRFQPHA